MSKKIVKLSLIQKAQNKFKKFKSMDLNYRTILSEALALIYEIYQRTSDEKFEEELKKECKKAGLDYDTEHKLKLILELCVPKPDKSAAICRYKARIRTYVRALEVFIEKKMDSSKVEKKLRTYGVEYYANPREKTEDEIDENLNSDDDIDENNKEISHSKKMTNQPLSERALNFFARNNLKINSFVILTVGNTLVCSDNEELIDKLKEYQKSEQYGFFNINDLKKKE